MLNISDHILAVNKSKLYTDEKTTDIKPYTPRGPILYANLPTPAASNVGYMYEVTDAFTTDDRFIGGAGVEYPAGTYVGIIKASDSSYKFNADVLNLHNKANLDGYYEDMTVGLSENLIDTKSTGSSQAFVYRTSCGTQSISDDGVASITSIKGHTCIIKQLAKNFADENIDWSSTTLTAGKWTSQCEASDMQIAERSDDYRSAKLYRNTAGWYNYFQLGVNCEAGHKYLVTVLHHEGSNIYEGGSYIQFDGANVNSTFNTTGSYVRASIIKEISTAGLVRFGASQNQNKGNAFYIKDLQIIDLTAYFGAGAEPTTADAALTLLGTDYHEYTEGTVQGHFKFTGIKTVGFNAYDYSAGTADVIGSNIYQITGTYTSLSLDGTAITPDSDGYFTPSATGTITVVGGDSTTTCIHLKWSGYRDGEYEAYWDNTRTVDILPYFPNGMMSVGSVYDELTPSKAIQRCELVGGVVTALTTPIETIISPPLNLTYKVADFGTEEVLYPSGATVLPISATIKYNSDFTREIANIKENYVSVSESQTFTATEKLQARTNLGQAAIDTDFDTRINAKEESSNKVTSLSASSTDTQYPSAKCVYDSLVTISFLGSDE